VLRLIFALFLTAGLAAAAAQDKPQARLPTTKLSAGMHQITAEVAATPRTRAVGLMWRERLEPNHGMLFVFDERSVQCFWMRNTLIPLAIAFLDDDGTIVNIAEMSPKSDDSHCAQRPVRYALEMEGGWFTKRGLAPGARLGGLPLRAPGAPRS
jgi:uncharacterized protein